MKIRLIIRQRESAGDHGKGPQRAVLLQTLFQKVVFGRHRNILEPFHVVQHALAGMGPDKRHGRDQIQPVVNTVIGIPDVGLCADAPEIAVRALQTAFPVFVPAVVRVEIPCEQRAPRDQKAIVDGLSLSQHRYGGDEKDAA